MPSRSTSPPTRLRKSQSAARAHLLLEQVELRQRAAAKFDRAAAMFFTRLGLEQATDQWVAAYKARRFAAFAEKGPMADLCCGIGGDLLALAAVGQTSGVDRDPVSACFAAANARVAGVGASELSLRTCEIDVLDAGDFAAWHIDPDRRPAGKRTTALEWSSPSLDVIERLLADFATCRDQARPGGRCRRPTGPTAANSNGSAATGNAANWSRGMANWRKFPASRRATVLSIDGCCRYESVGMASRAVEVTRADVDQFLFEPDPAVLAAHLAGALAAEHGLSAVSAGIAYLTGPDADRRSRARLL